MKKERQSNLELLRIIAMLMVVSLHFMGHGGILDNVKVFSNNFFMANLIESFSIYAVNVYVLISAYFMCDSKVTTKKMINIWTQVVFYTLFIYLILLVAGIVDFNLIDAIRSLLPIIFNHYDFVTAYIVLMFLSPFLNKLINSMNKNEFNKLIITLLIFFVFLGIVFPIHLIVSNYLSPFIVLYFIAAYIKRYLQNKLNKKRSLLLYVGSSLLIFFGTIILYVLGLDQLKGNLLSYRFILVILGSIGLFTLFLNINIQSKLINNISALTFGVFLIHENNFIRSFLYSDIFKMDTLYNNNFLILFTIIFIFIVFLTSSLIEYLRRKIFNVLKVDKISFKIINSILNIIKTFYKACKVNLK